MGSNIAYEDLKIELNAEKQLSSCLSLLEKVLQKDLLGVYLYGSAIVGGLQRYSDVDLLVVSSRATTHEEKIELTNQLLKISGIYMKSTDFPLEVTIVEKSEVNPWHYPPRFDFQYGEWLREEFESRSIEPWSSKDMPDLAILITQTLLASVTLSGPDPDQLLCKIPYKDFMVAVTDVIPDFVSELDTDTRNVLLALARFWSIAETNTIRSKAVAAAWVINYLPEQYYSVMQRARAIYEGKQKEDWDDLRELIKPCADFMLAKIHDKLSIKLQSSNLEEAIKIIT